MSLLLSPRYWLAAAGSFTVLSLAGAGLAGLLVPEPPVFHRTSFFEFALPPEWRCQREGTETVCRPAPNPEGKTDAMIIFTAKYRADYDTLEAYHAHLAQPRSWEKADGTPVEVTVESNEERRIGRYRWIDAVHFQSEVPGYYTRYLATVTTHIGVLITFSAHRSTAS